jgi:hypothetical protein
MHINREKSSSSRMQERAILRGIKREAGKKLNLKAQ